MKLSYYDKLNYCPLSAIAPFLSLSLSFPLFFFVLYTKKGADKETKREKGERVSPERVAGCYGWVSPRLSGLRLSKHTNRPPSLLLLRGAAWVYPSVKRAGLRGRGGGGRG